MFALKIYRGCFETFLSYAIMVEWKDRLRVHLQ